MSQPIRPTNWLRGAVGGAMGAAAGYALFLLVAQWGFYALILPGAMLGVGCGLMSGAYSQALGVACGVAALVLGMLVEWHTRPFIADESLAYFLTHVHQLSLMTLLLILLGTACGYSFGRGRPRFAPSWDHSAE